MRTKPDLNLDSILNGYIAGAMLLLLDEWEKKPQKGRKRSLRTVQIELHALTSKSIKEQAELTGLTPGSITVTRARNQTQIAKHFDEAVRFFFEIMLTTAVKRTQEITALIPLPESERAAKLTEYKEEKRKEISEIHADTLSPILFLQILKYICAFIGNHREIEKVLQAGFVPAEHEDYLHQVAWSWYRVRQDTDLSVEWVAEYLSSLIMLVHMEVAIPLIRAFREKIRTDYRRMKVKVDWDNHVEELSGSVRAGLTHAMAEVAYQEAMRFKDDDSENAHEGVFDALSPYVGALLATGAAGICVPPEKKE